jgi:hypothetical protein
MLKKLFALLIPVIFASGCTPSHQDLTGTIASEQFAIPANVYYGLAWLSDRQIAVAYISDYVGGRDNAVALYDLDTGELLDLSEPELPADCIRGWNTGPLEKLADGNLAFIYDCVNAYLVDQYQLVKWDRETNEFTELMDYGGEIFATTFSFAPSMIEYVQEDSTDISMGNRLYKVSLTDSSMTQMVPDFVRAKVPSWSPTSNRIAFWGTEGYPAKSEDFETFREIQNLVLHPWDLYIMDQNGNNAQKILSGVKYPGLLKWSPEQDLLAFGGTVDGVEGVWILDPQDKESARVFGRSELFDWSSDGTKLILVDHVRGEINETTPVGAYILELPDCIFSMSCIQ